MLVGTWLVGWLVGRLLGWLKEDAMGSDKVEEGRWKKVVESLMVRSLRKYLVDLGACAATNRSCQ